MSSAMLSSHIVNDAVNDAVEAIGFAQIQASTTAMTAFTVAVDASGEISQNEISEVLTRLTNTKLHAGAHIVRVTPQPNSFGGTTFSVEVILPRSIR